MRDDIEAVRNIEKYLDDMERINVKKKLVLSLFGADIYRREDFDNPDKLSGLKDRLEKAGYTTDIAVDHEHNLYALNLRDNEKGARVHVDYEFCSQEDYQDHLQNL